MSNNFSDCDIEPFNPYIFRIIIASAEVTEKSFNDKQNKINKHKIKKNVKKKGSLISY